MNNNWKKQKFKNNGIVKNNIYGDKLVSGNNKSVLHNNIIRTNTISDLEYLINILPIDIKNYVYECLNEHSQIISNILMLGYEGEELFFRDFLSGPQNEITCKEIDVLQEAFKDDRYELIPTILFANKKLENKEDNIAETSSIVIEFHKRGMAF